MYWLVVHGALVWQTALLVLLLAGGLVAVRRSRRRVHVEARAARVRLGEIRRRLGDAHEGAEVTLAGTLRASGPCKSFVDGAEAAATSAGPEGAPSAVDARAEQLDLVLEDGLVRVEGPVSVLVGAREAWMKAPIHVLPRSMLDRAGLARDTWVSTRPAVFRAIGGGDAVVARGVLRRRVGGEGRAGYRESAAAWSLVPIVPPQEHLGPGSVVLAAERAPRVSGPVGGPAAAGAGVGLAIFAAVFVGFAATLDLRLDPIERIALGAATPLRRAEALKEYRVALERKGAQERLAPEALDQLVEVELSSGGCGDAADVLLSHGQWARAADFGERCGRADVVARAAFELGDFARVVREMDGHRGIPGALCNIGRMLRWTRMDKLAVRTHLLTGNLARAEVAARDILGAAAQGGWADQPDVRALACIADALATRRGDKAARLRLYTSSVPECEVLADDIELGEGRGPRDVLVVEHPYGRPRNRTIRDLQEMLVGSAFAANQLYSSLDPRDALLQPASGPLAPALAQARLEALSREPEPEPGSKEEGARRTLLAYLLAVQARFALATGDWQEAVRLAERAAVEAHQPVPSKMDVERDAVRVAAGVDFDPRPWEAWLAGPHPGMKSKDDPPPPASESTIAALLGLRATPEPERGVHPRDEKQLGPVAKLFRVENEADERVMFDAARGMSVDLSDLLWRQGSASERTLRLIAVTNRSAGGRDELLGWARWGSVTRCIGCDVATTFSDVTAHLALAEAFGDEALAAELRPIVARFRAALLRRETAVPLAIFESLALERWLPEDRAK